METNIEEKNILGEGNISIIALINSFKMTITEL
jgi:hypothetical protein